MEQSTPSPSLKPGQGLATDGTSGAPPRLMRLLETGRFVDRVPLAPRPLHPGREGQPLPVAISEVEKLCDIEQGTTRSNLELPTTPSGWPVVISAEPEDCSLSSFTTTASFRRVVDQAVRTALRDVLIEGLEVIKPSQSLSSAISGHNPGQTT